MTSTSSIYHASDGPDSESSFSSVEAAKPVSLDAQYSTIDEHAAIFDSYGEIIQVLSSLLFAMPSRTETKVLFRIMQHWLKQHSDGITFNIQNCQIRDIELQSDYTQQPASLVLLTDYTKDKELPYGVVLKAADETLICFYVAPERVKQLAMEHEQAGSYSSLTHHDLEAWPDSEDCNRKSFAMWVRANLAYFSVL